MRGCRLFSKLRIGMVCALRSTCHAVCDGEVVCYRTCFLGAGTTAIANCTYVRASHERVRSHVGFDIVGRPCGTVLWRIRRSLALGGRGRVLCFQLPRVGVVVWLSFGPSGQGFSHQVRSIVRDIPLILARLPIPPVPP